MLKRAMFVIIAVFALALVSAVPARAQFGAIEGDIKDAEGKPATGYSILIERVDIKGTYRLKEKDIKKGHYFHGGLPLGRYNVSLLKGEQVVDKVQGVRVGLGDPQVINFDLKQQADRALAAQAGVQLQQTQSGEVQLSKEQRDKIEQAMKARDQARKKDEQFRNSYNAGMELLKTNQFDQAAAQFQAAVDADPAHPSVHLVLYQLGESHFSLAKGKRGEEANAALTKAVEAYQKAIAGKPDEPAYHDHLAQALAFLGRMEEAEQAAVKAAQFDTTSPGRTFFNLGAVLTNSGRGKEAGVFFKKATEADPNYADAWYRYGESLLSEAKLDEKSGKTTPAPGTVEAFQKYLDLQPNGPLAPQATAMIQALGSTVQTEIKAEKKGRKR